MEYPEHDKLRACREHSQVCGDFLEWLKRRYRLVESVLQNPEAEELDYYYEDFDVTESTVDLLAEFFGIDQNKLETEKREMLAELRGNTPEVRKELGL
jgi:hypothetical protein